MVDALVLALALSVLPFPQQPVTLNRAISFWNYVSPFARILRALAVRQTHPAQGDDPELTGTDLPTTGLHVTKEGS
jgi:hypothetical protein